jgi:hypothetical protein
LSQSAVVVACGAASEGRDRARSAHDLEPDRRVEKRGLEERMKTVKGPPIDGLPLLSRPRRFSIADLMAAVGLAALGMTLATMVVRSEFAPGERSVLGVVAATALASLACQWPLSSLRASDRHSWPSALLGITAVLLAIVTVICVGILAVALAEGAALLFLMLLTMVVYLTTWD